jgi:hypothetical protein
MAALSFWAVLQNRTIPMDAIPSQLPLPQAALIPAAMPLEYSTAPAAQRPLYSPGAVGLATFFGAPIAGAVVMAINYRRLGRPGSATKAVIWGLVGTAALLALSFAISSHSAGLPIAIVPLVVMLQLARSQQGETFERHKAAGGPVASMWKAFGIGVVSLVAILAICISIALAADLVSPSKQRLASGGSEILYSGSATHADAQALADALTKAGYFGAGRATTVLLAKSGTGTTLQFVVNETAAQDDNTLAIFAAVAQDVAPSVGGKPITMQLVNPELKVLKTKRIDD